MAKKKILIVDDEVGFTRVVKLNLDATGKYDVMVENKGAEALDAVQSFKPDLIFLDIIMPDVEGSEVARQIKADPKLKDIPIVFLTATVTRQEVGAGRGLIGGLAFLAKPVHVQDLVNCIEQYTRE